MAGFPVTVGRSKKRLRWLARVIVWPAVLYLMLRWFEHRQVYLPSRTMAAMGSELGRPFEDAYFHASDGVRVNGWLFPADPHSPRAHLVVLLCHGNAGNISHRLDQVSALLETGASVLVFDYRGYGRSEGRPGEEGTYLDAVAVYQWLRQKGFAATNIVALGESLGGGVATELALREPLGGLILQSTYTSVTDLGAELFPWLPVRWLGTIKYDTRGKLPRVKVPILILHSRADTLIRFHHAERNFAAAHEPKTLFEIRGDHNDFLLADPRRYVAGIEDFLGTIGSGRSQPSVDAAADAPR
jgi:uncharacterized protein